MRILLSKKEMKECDRVTIEEFGIPSVVLMERAALGCVEALEKSKADLSRILVVCGSGNNGGDGFAIARLLFLAGYDVTICFAGREASCTSETERQKKICTAYGVNFCSNPKMNEYTVIVDALFGVGLSREISGSYAERIAQINESPAFVLAVDIPSGIDGDTGAVWGCAVHADLTVTFAFEKPGHYLGEGRACCGRIVLCQMGITKESLKADRAHFYCFDKTDFSRLPKRAATANKGTCGKVLLVAGSFGMCGAAILAAKAALKSGAGLVRVYTDACNQPILQQALPEAIVNHTSSIWTEELTSLMEWADMIAIGPGLGMSAEKREVLSYILENGKKPLILDADALNLIARYHMKLADYAGESIVTPHLGEMARLCGKSISQLAADLPSAAKEYAIQNHTTCVLKDAGTVVSNGSEVYINVSGNWGMATAGSGDVLTGILAGIAAQNMPLFEAGQLGVYLHGCAGDAAAKRQGRRSMLAGDIIEGLAEVLRKYGQ